MSHRDSHGSVTARGQSAPAIKTEPTNPEHARPGHRQCHVVRWHGLGRKALTRFQHQRRHDSRSTRRYVYDTATGKVEKSPFE